MARRSTLQPRIVKRYARERLYDVASGTYVTVPQLQTWRSAGVPVAIRDTDTGQDVTHEILPSAKPPG